MTEYIVKCQANSMTGAWASSPALQHTLKRHREILRDYCAEYNRSRDNIRNQLQRFVLLFTFCMPLFCYFFQDAFYSQFSFLPPKMFFKRTVYMLARVFVTSISGSNIFA